MTKCSLVHGSKPWLVLSCLRDFGPQARADLNQDGRDQQAAAAISFLLRGGSIHTNEAGLLAITPAGRQRLVRCNRAQEADTVEVALPRQIDRMSGHYTGQELRRTCQRAGAYDAFAKPSLMGERRVYRKEIPA